MVKIGNACKIHKKAFISDAVFFFIPMSVPMTTKVKKLVCR